VQNIISKLKKKFIDVDNEYYKSFTLDSNSKLSKAPGEAAKKAGRAKKLNSNQIEAWNKRKFDVLYPMLKAKFSQNVNLCELLLATGDAILTHRPPRGKLVTETQLMRVRDELSTSKCISTNVNL